MPSTGLVTLVTGAAGNLGSAVARTFRQAGHRLVLVDRSPDRLEGKFPDLAGSPDCLLAGSVDLAVPDSIGRVVGSAVQRLGRVDVLVHTVGA
jgi:NAD(P)-dependent dehydrogenase (short-subunit alcohol dehydrogenase family)